RDRFDCRGAAIPCRPARLQLERDKQMNHTDALGHNFPGPVTTVIFDWAGTVLDFGCIAPVAAFREAFAADGVAITEAEARAPMGAAKREHLEMILTQPAVAQRWQASKGGISTQSDVDRL